MPTGRTVLTPADFTYLGAATLPLDTNGQTRFGYSTGALSGRVVDGAIHLFITGAQADTGWMDPVYEVAWHGAGTRCTLVTNWGDVTMGTRVSAAGNPCPLHGLLWDEESARLLWTYMDQYNVGGSHDPSLGASQLLASGVIVVGSVAHDRPFVAGRGLSRHAAGRARAAARREAVRRGRADWQRECLVAVGRVPQCVRAAARRDARRHDDPDHAT